MTNSWRIFNNLNSSKQALAEVSDANLDFLSFSDSFVVKLASQNAMLHSLGRWKEILITDPGIN